MALEARLKNRGKGSFQCHCGRGGCGGRLGAISLGGADDPPRVMFHPPSGFSRSKNAKTWCYSERAARQFRNQSRRVEQGDRPGDRPAMEPRSTGRYAFPVEPRLIGKLLVHMGAPSTGNLVKRGAVSQFDDSVILVKCPTCGFTNEIKPEVARRLSAVLKHGTTE